MELGNIHPKLANKLAGDSRASAKEAQLRHIMDWRPGICRKGIGKGFIYLDANQKRIRTAEELSRIRALAIPPAWTQVWICPRADGHLQASGRDARGRKQYRYHPRWREVRDENKYARMVAFAQALPRVRSRVDRDLALPGLPRAKVLAAIVKLLDCTFIRVGNDEYAQTNQSYGLATMRARHVKVSGSKIQFEFRGKSRVEHAISIEDRRLARIIRHCQDLPGYELFQYVDEDGTRVPIEAADVNEYLRKIAGAEFSTKDFRTWAGTVLAANALARALHSGSNAEAKRRIAKAIEEVARLLGNTKAVCRKCYIHPSVISAYTDGSLLRFLNGSAGHLGRKAQKKEIGQKPAVMTGSNGKETHLGSNGSKSALSPLEAAVLGFLQRQQNGQNSQRSRRGGGRQVSLYTRLRQSIKAVSRGALTSNRKFRRTAKAATSKSRA
jgi:DNA topoisomerase-1